MIVRAIEIQNMSETQLLDTRICDLDLNIEGSKYFKYIKQVLRELQSRGLFFEPYFWLSTEWFCPDGTMGIAMPFYLFHPKLETLELKTMGEAEGRTQNAFLKIFRHELGHACDNAYGLRKNKKRLKLFGSSKLTYPHDYEYQLYNQNYVKNIGPAYAQSHPDEDFAETFAVWLQAKISWKKKYKSTTALDKLLLMDEIMKGLKEQSVVLNNFRRMDTLQEQKITLREYYLKKRKYYKLDKFKIFDKGLKKILPISTKKSNLPLPESKMLIWRDYISQNLNYPLYKTDLVIKGIMQRSQHLGRVPFYQGKKTEAEMLDFLLEQTKLYVQKGLDRVIL